MRHSHAELSFVDPVGVVRIWVSAVILKPRVAADHIKLRITQLAVRDPHSKGSVAETYVYAATHAWAGAGIVDNRHRCFLVQTNNSADEMVAKRRSTSLEAGERPDIDLQRPRT